MSEIVYTNSDVVYASDGIRRAVKAEMARRDVSAAELARVTGLNKHRLYRRLKGDQAFTTDELALIAYALGMSPVEFWPHAEGAY